MLGVHYKTVQPPRCLQPTSGLRRPLVKLRVLAVPRRALVGQQPSAKFGVGLHGHVGYILLAFDSQVRPWGLCCRWHVWMSGLVSEGSGE